MVQLTHQNLQRIKMILHGIFIGLITIGLVNRGFTSIPDDLLFFFTSAAVENLICASVAYAAYYVSFHFNGNIKKIGFVLFVFTILFALASLKDFRIHEKLTLEQTFDYFTSFVGESLIFYILVFLINRFEHFRRYQLLDKELTAAKEQLLRNQLHPHFLYNAFNSLYSLALKNDPETPEYILKLSGMMRYLTDETDLQYVPLQKELDFIEKYIAIEKIRFGADARIQLHIEKTSGEPKMIAPFLLITLVENAFKHGFYTNQKDAFVKIDVQIGNEELCFTVANSLFDKQHFQETNREGKGLGNLKRRLALLYPKSSAIKTTITDTSYTAYLKLALDK